MRGLGSAGFAGAAASTRGSVRVSASGLTFTSAGFAPRFSSRWYLSTSSRTPMIAQIKATITTIAAVRRPDEPSLGNAAPGALRVFLVGLVVATGGGPPVSSMNVRKTSSTSIFRKSAYERTKPFRNVFAGRLASSPHSIAVNTFGLILVASATSLSERFVLSRFLFKELPSFHCSINPNIPLALETYLLCG